MRLAVEAPDEAALRPHSSESDGCKKYLIRSDLSLNDSATAVTQARSLVLGLVDD